MFQPRLQRHYDSRVAEGRIYFFPANTDPKSLAMPANEVEHWLCYWLCYDRLKTMTIIMTPDGHPSIQALALRRRLSPKRMLRSFRPA